jgi:hypothetical protein
MPDLFRAYSVPGTRIPTYFIESTAPNNVDDRPAPAALAHGLVPIDPDKAVENIAHHLSGASDANLVVMVHGFNNPEHDVLKWYAAASDAIENDPEICKCPGLVCVGYRWPSEKMGQPSRGTAAALPSLPHWLLWCGVLVSALYPFLALIPALRDWQLTVAGHVLIIFGWTLIGTVVALALLRATVYFRDGYRAANYGAPDLIEIIRQIDHQIIQHDPGMPNEVGTDSHRRNCSSRTPSP